MKMLAPASLLCLALLVACGGGGSATSAAASLSGNWQMVLQLNPTFSNTESGFLLQSGNNLTGNVVLTGQTSCPGLGTAQGQVDGANVTITVNQIQQTVKFTGTASSDGSSITGNYSILENGCGASQVGTWTATQVKPLNGTFHGTFTSTLTNGLTFDVAVSVTQGPNNAGSNTSLSGTVTSSNAPCFSDATVSGVIGGTSVVLNLFTKDGTALGQYRATTTTDATTLTGTYRFLPQENICGDDWGDASMSFQQ